MLFEQVLPHFRAGRRIHRTSWLTGPHPNRAVHPVGSRYGDDTVYYSLILKDILADDWQIYPTDMPQEEKPNNIA